MFKGIIFTHQQWVRFPKELAEHFLEHLTPHYSVVLAESGEYDNHLESRITCLIEASLPDLPAEQPFEDFSCFSESAWRKFLVQLSQNMSTKLKAHYTIRSNDTDEIIADRYEDWLLGTLGFAAINWEAQKMEGYLTNTIKPDLAVAKDKTVHVVGCEALAGSPRCTCG